MLSFLSGGGGAGECLRQHGWSGSPIGQPDGWSQPLKTLVSIMLGAKQPMFLCWGDQNTLIYNDAYAEILSHKHPGSMGQPFLEVWSEIAVALRPIVAQALGGEPVHMDNIMLMMERNGYPEETHFAFSYTPVRSEYGTIDGFFCACTETTEQVLHGRRLASERDAMHALYEQAPGFIATTQGPDHRFTFANASYKRLIGRDRLVGRTVHEALPELAEQGIIGVLDRVYETGEPFVATRLPMDLSGPDEGGPQRHYLSFVYQPVRDGSGRVTGLFCEGYDSTAEFLGVQRLHALEARLAHSFRVNAMGMMMTTLAHELNQPLTVIANCSEAVTRLLAPLADKDIDVSGPLALLQESNQRAGAIIRTIREFTKQGKTTRCNFELAPAVEDCIKLVLAGGCVGFAIKNNTPAGLSITGDRVQIQQIVMNLLTNACDAVDGAGEPYVAISAEHRNDETIVTVMDRGPGLSAEARENLFGWAESSKEGGMGLGLSICKTIVDAHHGKIWVAKSDASGSEFCFSIPDYDPDANIPDDQPRPLRQPFM